MAEIVALSVSRGPPGGTLPALVNLTSEVSARCTAVRRAGSGRTARG